MTGREWIIKSTVLIALALLVAGGPIADSIINDRKSQTAFFDAAPWIPLVLACLKMAAAAWPLGLTNALVALVFSRSGEQNPFSVSRQLDASA